MKIRATLECTFIRLLHMCHEIGWQNPFAGKVCFLIFPYSEAKCLQSSLCLELLGKFSSKSLTLTDVLVFMAKMILTIQVKSFIFDRNIEHLTSKIG